MKEYDFRGEASKSCMSTLNVDGNDTATDTLTYLTPISLSRSSSNSVNNATSDISSEGNKTGTYADVEDVDNTWNSSYFCGGSAENIWTTENSKEIITCQSCIPCENSALNFEQESENILDVSSQREQIGLLSISEGKLLEICEHIRKTTNNDVWPATSTTTGKKVICCQNTEGTDVQKLTCEIEIIFPKPCPVNNEKERIKIVQESLCSSDYNSRSQNAKEIIEKHAENLFRDHKNLSMISASPYRIKHNRVVKCWCIVFFCSCKGYVPSEEKRFPEKLDLYPIDVREGCFEFGARHKENNKLAEQGKPIEKLSIGECIFFEETHMLETIGTFVELSEGKTGVLTCAHATVPRARLSDYNTYVRSRGDGIDVYDSRKTTKIGKVRNGSFEYGKRNATSVDAAVIEVDDKIVPEYGQFMKSDENVLTNLGFKNEMPPCACSGDFGPPDNQNNECFKSGCTTGLTSGCIVFRSAAIRGSGLGFDKLSLPYIMYGQIHIVPMDGITFFEVGDSGSVVFQKNRNTGDICAVALAIGKINNECVATPIQQVLCSLNIEKLKTFQCDRASYVSVPPTMKDCELNTSGDVDDEPPPRACRIADPIIFISKDGNEVRGKNVKIVSKDQNILTEFINRDNTSKEASLKITTSSGHTFIGPPGDNWLWRKVYDNENCVTIYQHR